MRSFAGKISFPSAYAVLMLVIVLGAALTWMLPAGRYDLLRYDQANRTFVAERVTGEERLPAEQATLDRLGIQIQIEHFEKGNIRKAVSIPGTYHTVTANPQGLIAILKAPVLGTYEAIDVILFVLVIGGFIGVFQKTGAFDAGLNALVLRLRGREAWLIIIVTALISLGGTTFGMAEETLAFYPLLVPVFLAAGYDVMVPVAVIFIGTSVGTMASTINPFAIIIASNAAGISWTGGLPGRVIMWALATGVSIAYILRYARKVQLDPKRSLATGHSHVPAAGTRRGQIKTQVDPENAAPARGVCIDLRRHDLRRIASRLVVSGNDNPVFCGGVTRRNHRPPRRKGFHRDVHRRSTKSSRRWIDYRHRARRDAHFG